MDREEKPKEEKSSGEESRDNMVSTTVVLPTNFNGGSLFPNHNSSSNLVKWGWKRHQDVNSVAYRTRGQAFQVLANPNVSPRKGSSNEVIMVDPLEAKRLAAKQMQQIKAKEKFKRQRQIEAINGAWAMIGLAAGLVIEGQTGRSIPAQLADYWHAVIHFFLP